MEIIFHKNFYKDLKSLDSRSRAKAIDRIEFFAMDKFNTILNNHALKGEYEGYRSINISGDIRAIYKEVEKDTAIFIAIGTHSNLYK